MKRRNGIIGKKRRKERKGRERQWLIGNKERKEGIRNKGVDQSVREGKEGKK